MTQPSAGTPLTPHCAADDISASADGQWIATASISPPEVVLWAAASATRIAALAMQGPAEVRFDPAGRWLATASTGEIRLWQAGSWQPHLRFRIEPTFIPAVMAFSANGRMLAIRKSATELQLVDPESGREWATIPGARSRPLCFSADGTLLVVAEDAYRLKVWNLRLLREELGKLKLDWDLPPYPPAPAAPSPLLRVEVVTE